jgi:hypothetical protein
MAAEDTIDLEDSTDSEEVDFTRRCHKMNKKEIKSRGIFKNNASEKHKLSKEHEKRNKNLSQDVTSLIEKV